MSERFGKADVLAPFATLRRVAVLRALPGLGDFLCAVPALRALRAAAPQAEIALIGLAATRGLASRYAELIDAQIDFPGFPGLPEVPFDAPVFARFLGEMQGRFDLLVQMHGSGVVSNTVAQLIGAARTAGFYAGGHRPPEPAAFWPYPSGGSEAERWLALTTLLGAPPASAVPDFPVSPADEAALDALGEALTPGRVAVIHPGASEPTRRWPAARFAAVADALAARGLRIVLTGSAGEAEVTQAVAAAMHAPALDLAGRTALGPMAALLGRAALTVTNDTGVSHLAAAVGAPSVVLFLASDLARWAPVRRERHIAVGQGRADGTTAVPPPPAVDEVLAAVHRLLPGFADAA